MQALPRRLWLPSPSFLLKALPRCTCLPTILASGSASGSTHLSPKRKRSVCLKLMSMFKGQGLTIKSDPPSRAVCPLPQHPPPPPLHLQDGLLHGPHKHRPPGCTPVSCRARVLLLLLTRWDHGQSGLQSKHVFAEGF